MKSLRFTLSGLFTCIFFLAASTIHSQPCQRPNVIMIICDDMRYDAFDITGGPAFLNTPFIDQIANEGARFDNYYCVYSLCIPARASIMTGLYPHSHGAVDNCNTIKKGIPTLAEVLDSSGYNTAMIGKYHVAENWQPGWDYWLSTKGKMDYTNPTFFYFNNTISINGNIEKIIDDSVHRYLSKVDTPFFITVGHLAPHRKCIPLPQYEGVFSNKPMPVPDNFYPFPSWYPSFLYDDESNLYEDISKVKKDYQGYYEGILGIEDNTKDIFNILNQRNLLDNTMIILLSDNGALFGEHLLKGKGEPYEPSEHLPLFIRYPQWYSPNTVINGNFFCLSIDIMPTILDACCIDGTNYHMQGTSLRNLISGEVERPSFLYETVKLGEDACEGVENNDKPSIRSVRSKDYKYISNHCYRTTEEFFDLTNDPLETTNQIHNLQYANQIDAYRHKLDELRVQYFDTLSADTAFRNCYLVKADKGSIGYIDIENPIGLRLDPNPAGQNVNLVTTIHYSGPADILITNMLGEILYHNESNLIEAPLSKQIDISNFPQGIYFVEVRQGDKIEVQTLLRN